MAQKIFNVLFICTGNSARSILAEGLMNETGKGRFRAYSAGSHPKGAVHALALKELARLHIPTDGFRSKSWEEFAKPGAPRGTSCLPSAIKLRAKSVPYGQGSR